VNAQRIETRARWELPLAEASALSLRQDGAGGGLELLAVDDERFELALSAIDGGVVPPAEPVDIRAAVANGGGDGDGGSDFEGVASDASRRVFVLQERGQRVLVLDEGLSGLHCTITLSVPRGHADLGREWHADENTRGEGLVLLRSGHLLVGKERDAPWLIEFGPPGDDPAGFAPGDALRPDETFSLPRGGTVAFEVLAAWRVDPEAGVGSVNDLATDAGGRLHVVSAGSRSLARSEALDPRGGVAALTAWPLPADLFENEDDKAEGLVFAPGLGWLVALDRGRRVPNLFCLSGVPS